MAASFQAKDSQVLNTQLKVQEVCLLANDPLLTVSGGDLVLQLNETPASVVCIIKATAAGVVTRVVGPTIATTTIVITGEGAALATTAYIVKYITAE